MSPIKCIEIAGISDVKWPGITPRTGDPLQMKVSAQRRSFIELLQPAHVRTESRIITIRFTTGGECTTLIRLIVYVEHQTRVGACWVYGQPSPICRESTGGQNPVRGNHILLPKATSTRRRICDGSRDCLKHRF